MTNFIDMPKHVKYQLNLHLHRSVKDLCYSVKGKPLVYCIRCFVTNMVYIGSTLVPHDRLYSHLVTGKNSNYKLQEAIDKYGLEKFSVLILEFVSLPKEITYKDKVIMLRAVEQKYIDMFPKSQLYNPINAKSSV